MRETGANVRDSPGRTRGHCIETPALEVSLFGLSTARFCPLTRTCLRLGSRAALGKMAAMNAVIPPTARRGSELELTEIRLKKGESVEKALRRLKKKIDREGTLKEVRNHRHFEKPSERRRRKEKAARFSAMLTARYADL